MKAITVSPSDTPSSVTIEVYGTIPHKHRKEAEQFERVLEIVRTSVGALGDWVVVLMNFEYEHNRSRHNPQDQDWRGQFDIVVLSEARIIILELKAQKMNLLLGRSDARRWWRRIATGLIVPCRSYFDQVSKQRCYLLQDYLNGFKERYDIPEPNHYVVDARLVFLPGSELSRFYYKVPADYRVEKFETDVLEHIQNEEDREFVRGCYVPCPSNRDLVQLRRLRAADLRRLSKIWTGSGLRLKTAKWFELLTEDELASDLTAPGSDRFRMTLEHARLIASDLGLA